MQPAPFISFVLAFLLVAAASCQATPAPVAQPALCFPATGHTVPPDFAQAFEARGGLAVLGYPITEVFEQEGRRVQCFEYVCLEDHPDAPEGPTIKLSMLGERLGRRQPPLPSGRIPPAMESTSRYYPWFGHAISGDFLAFFDSQGGVERFGFPIGEPLLVEGQLVQDFQRARFIWHARAAPEQRVGLEPIGRVYVANRKLDPALLAPRPCPAEAQVVH